MGSIWNLVVCCTLACVALPASGARHRRFPADSGSSSSSSSSSNSNGWNTATIGSGGFPNQPYGGVGFRGGFGDGQGGFGGGFGQAQAGFAGPQGGFGGNQGGFDGNPGGFGQPGFYFPQQPAYNPGYDMNALFQQFLMFMAARGFNPQLGFPPVNNGIGGDSFGTPGSASSGGSGPNSASASVNLGPQGGQGQISVTDDLGLRSGFESSLPAPASGTIGTFSSSSSGSSDINGKKTSFRTATVGATDGEKVYFKQV